MTDIAIDSREDVEAQDRRHEMRQSECRLAWLHRFLVLFLRVFFACPRKPTDWVLMHPPRFEGVRPWNRIQVHTDALTPRYASRALEQSTIRT